MKHKIKYYPVGNGDHSLIILDDGTIIQVDCNIRQASHDDKQKDCYNVKTDLLKLCKKREGNYFVDVFILTHGDLDHIRGFEKNYYQGDPANYTKENREENEIIIDEMWFSPMIAEEHNNTDEEAYQKEAERRLKLHLKKDNNKDLPGNRIRIVGYDGNKKYADLNHLRATPGKVVTKFNYKEQNTFSVFIHSPFKEQLLSAEKDKNSTSIVFQARFKNSAAEKEFNCLAIFGGDADYIAWGIILQKTIASGKDVTEQALYWDLFLAPHHCSWTFFNDTPQLENKEPKEDSLEILKYRRLGGKIIASSKKIIDNDDNPPHYAAKMEYLRSLENNSNFLNTAITPEEDAPEPIIFEITTEGIQKLKCDSEIKKEKLIAATAVAASAIIKKPWGY